MVNKVQYKNFNQLKFLTITVEYARGCFVVDRWQQGTNFPFPARGTLPFCDRCCGGYWWKLNDESEVFFYKYIMTFTHKTNLITRMWANAKRDGRSAEYTWRPLFNAANFG